MGVDDSGKDRRDQAISNEFQEVDETESPDVSVSQRRATI